MRGLFGFLFVFAVAGSSFAHTAPTCTASLAVTIDDREGVTVKTVSFHGPRGPLSAYVFVPDTEEPVAGIAFSQSAIQYADSRTDLRPFARALALAGAASIMLDGTIDWHTPNDDSKRPMSELACAANWLLANAKLDLDRLAIGGPLRVGGLIKDEPFCPVPDKQPCGNPWFYINFGWASPREILYTEKMKTPQGQLWMTRLPKDFYLKDVKLEWLTESVLPSQAARR